MIRILSYTILIALCGCELACRKAEPLRDYEALRLLLNSERIERIFGSYGIEVLEKNPIRVSNLYSQESGVRVCRTLAIVIFSDSIPDELALAYQEITQGSSLGATLKKAGWTIEKRHQFFGEISAGNRFRELAHLDADENDGDYAIHLYALWAAKEDSRHHFSTIAEIHHPQYLTLKDLKEIYATDLRENLIADSVDLQLIGIAKEASE